MNHGDSIDRITIKVVASLQSSKYLNFHHPLCYAQGDVVILRSGKERNVDVYRFINSRDIRDYLKNINYQFTSIEAASLKPSFLLMLCVSICHAQSVINSRSWQ